MKKVREPLEVTVVGQNIIVADDNYRWLQILPEKSDIVLQSCLMIKAIR